VGAPNNALMSSPGCCSLNAFSDWIKSGVINFIVGVTWDSAGSASGFWSKRIPGAAHAVNRGSNAARHIFLYRESDGKNMKTASR
jgi:hypothetical protein